MPHPISPKPQSFASDKERDYWHHCQDIAFRAGVTIIEQEGASWLITSEGKKLLYRPPKDGMLWWQSWLQLKARYPGLARLWVGGRVLNKPRRV